MQGQGQGNNSNSFPGNFYFNGGLISYDQHREVPDDDDDGNTSMRWIGQSSSNLDTQNHIGFAQYLGDDFWLSPLGDHAGTSQRFEARHSDEQSFTSFLRENVGMSQPITFNPVQENIGMISTEHVPVAPSSFFPGQEAGSGPLEHNLDLNAVVPEGSGIGASQDNGPYLSLDLFRAGTSSGDHITTSGGSSSPVMIYSGIAGYVLEESISRDGLPADGQRRLLCKRRAPEFASREVNSGDSSSYALQAENIEQPWVTLQENVINSLNAADSLINHLNSSGLFVSAQPERSNFHGVPNEAGELDNFHRNTRLRRTASQQIPTPTNLWTWNSSNSNVQATSQPMFSVSNDPFTITSSAPAVNPAMQPIVQVSNSLQAPQPSEYWNGTTRSSVGSSSIFLDQSTVNAREAFGQEENLRNNRRDMMINPSANMQANLNLANGNATFHGNIASSSRIQSSSGMHLPSSSMRFPQPNIAEQHAQRVRDVVDHSNQARRQGNYCPVHSPGACPAVPVMDVSVRGGHARRPQAPIRLGPRAESADQRRRRLISELRNAFGIVRRPSGLQLEFYINGGIQDVMVIDRSFLYGMPGPIGIHENHDDMRLDVDDMSYEELLDLEEQIGNVSTGLSEQSIWANLRRRKYQSITIGPSVETEKCCICQEDYGDEEELGKLDCGHDFHFNCIKQWLLQKNSCPICKKTALAI
ncbi:hypothetical protein REPUB_Repub09cG0162400 [Reevesia pubescens]